MVQGCHDRHGNWLLGDQGAECPHCVWVASALEHHHHDVGWSGGWRRAEFANQRQCLLFSNGCRHHCVRGISAASAGFCHNGGNQLLGHQDCFCPCYPSLDNNAGVAPWPFHCYHVDWGCSNIKLCLWILSLSFPHSTFPMHSIMPTFRCTDAWISQACLCVEQRKLCWIIVEL